MNGKRIIIVTGGTLGDWALGVIQENDVLVGSDRGALYLIQHGYKPHISLGDFDSVTAEELSLIRSSSVSFIECDPIHKDLTDTEMAFNWALAEQPEQIILLGALGTRFDHSLANVHLLRKGTELGIACSIIDANNQIIVMNQTTRIERGRYSHISLLPLSLEVTGITLHGFAYPLHQATLQIGQSLGISNILNEPEGLIELQTGLLLVIQSKD
ncbi:thiamine diphosphokinase [Paenibacillus sp. CGMCC 1.16610]|uniref:Thiamine diphosphokinase n=1 Tax=Paenibacillus anseongense TaxID=2682845 RepID=A0ABW9UIG6_9BACL|nr:MULTISPECIES: thiamine diphosphokinase [Paenibacillus]MBA2942759.1 thiamine diphosphokinase [Paenibacillus sp. CGMCC 1.16610]MVQ38245.1 thiamine diphosphokinase [Paenibacillus anseongense]